MSRQLLGRHYATGKTVELEIDGRSIARISTVSGRQAEQARLVWLVPTLVDIQVNGFGGWDLNADEISPRDVTCVTKALWSAGVAHYCPTITTGPLARMLRSLEAVALACHEDAATSRAVLGIHMEGPYISPEDGPRGAHALQYVRPPDWEEFCKMQDAADGRIRMVTLAPELPGAIEFIEKLTSEGIVVGLGHLAADSKQIAAAVEAGARISTHLGNGAHAVLPRHPNYLWDQLACDGLWASIIPDGHHLPPAVIKTFLRAKGIGRTILVSDAVFAAGLPPGEYTFQGQKVDLTPEGCVRLSGTPFLAGSALRLVDGVSNVISFTGVCLQDAIRMAAINPRRLLGDVNADEHFIVGAPADLLVLREDPSTSRLSLDMTIVDGELVYERASGDHA